MEWTGARFADMPTVEVSTWIDAPPGRVWELVSDVELMPGMSTELQRAHWVGDRRGLGATFVGHNEHRARGRWSTTSQVVEYEPGRVFAWSVADPLRPAALWRFRLEAVRGGTGLSHWVRLGPGPSGVTAAIEAMPDSEREIVFMRLREFERNMTETLAHIKRRAES